MRRNQAVLPRYLQVAHWLLEHQRWMTARDMAAVFNISPKHMCDVFANIRQRYDLFDIIERKKRCQNGYENELKVIHINPYRLDGRLYPHVIRTAPSALNHAAHRKLSGITWQDLTSRPWHQFMVNESM